MENYKVTCELFQCRWQYLDRGQFKDYDDTNHATIESAFQAGNKEVKVYNVGYVRFPLFYSFTKLPPHMHILHFRSIIALFRYVFLFMAFPPHDRSVVTIADTLLILRQRKKKLITATTRR